MQGGRQHHEWEDKEVADPQRAPVDRGGPLEGLEVLDLTEHMAGPFCTMILADMGAEVVKLERPDKGDSVRAWGDGSERNPYFRYINRNKKGITLDYKEPEGKALFLRLVKGIDVRVSILSAVLAFVFSCGVAVVFGAVPAYRASLLNPSEALHHE